MIIWSVISILLLVALILGGFIAIHLIAFREIQAKTYSHDALWLVAFVWAMLALITIIPFAVLAVFHGDPRALLGCICDFFILIKAAKYSANCWDWYRSTHLKE